MHREIPLNCIENIDCVEGMKRLPDNSVDLVLTSPPYNFDMAYDGHNDKQEWAQYISWLETVWRECYRILKPDGRLIVNIQPRFSEYVPTHHLISASILNIGFKWKGEILWEKNNYNCKYCSWGSWKSPSSPYMKYTWEFIEVYCKSDYKHKGKKEDIDITADEFKEWVLAKWSIAPERKMREYGHPAMFPEELVRRCLKLFTFKNDVVCDPFMGAGTTAVVCQKLGRYFIGFDTSQKYCDIARDRLDSISCGLDGQIKMEV